ncbi:MAG: hypothetical protein V4612_04595 [Pseudomonadota bacterium]
MTIFINITILLGLTLVIAKFITTNNSYQKIVGFYFTFNGLIILILTNSINKFQSAIDIAFLLFLLELAAILFLLLNKKTYN